MANSASLSLSMPQQQVARDYLPCLQRTISCSKVTDKGGVGMEQVGWNRSTHSQSVLVGKVGVDRKEMLN